MGYFHDRFELVREAGLPPVGGYTAVFKMVKQIQRDELPEFSETCSRSKAGWLSLFERSVAGLKTEESRQRIIPARALLLGRIHGARTAKDYAATMKPALSAVVAAELDEIIRSFARC